MRRNSRRLNRLIPINERKVKLKRKSDQKSRSENNRGKSDEKEKRQTDFFLKRHGIRGAANLGRCAAPADWRRHSAAAAAASGLGLGAARVSGRLGLWVGLPQLIKAPARRSHGRVRPIVGSALSFLKKK